MKTNDKGLVSRTLFYRLVFLLGTPLYAFIILGYLARENATLGVVLEGAGEHLSMWMTALAGALFVSLGVTLVAMLVGELIGQFLKKRAAESPRH